MRSRCSYIVNNCLVHGICNYDCALCSLNKGVYDGPKAFQSRSVTEALVARVREAAAAGLRISMVGCSGHGEPTLHPELGERLHTLTGLRRDWDPGLGPAPVVSMVTNGSRLLEGEVQDAITRDELLLAISLPTVDPEAWGGIMGRPGAQLTETVLPGIAGALALQGSGRLHDLLFHLSPPQPGVIREHFPQTVRWLARTARERGVERLVLTLFPAVSNRSGAMEAEQRQVDTFRDLFRRYQGQRLDGVVLELRLAMKTMFPTTGHLLDLLWAYRYPCLWNRTLLVGADGAMLCINDQAGRHPFGNIRDDALQALVERKEGHLPGALCEGCNQRPTELRGSPLASTLGLAARLRYRLARLG